MPVPYDLYDYFSYWENRSYEDKSERLALERFFKKIPQKKRLVDIGGGFGRLSSLYAKHFEKCVVLDPSEKNLETGRRIYAKYPNIEFKQGSLPSLPFENERFETALMIRVSHHLEKLTPSFEEISRILVKGGYFILEFANKNHFLAVMKALFKFNFKYFSDYNPIERRSPESIKENKITFVNHHPKKILSDLEKSGFEIIDLLSVSNLRNQTLKRIIPDVLPLKLEKISQKLLAKIYFGPSIFVLARKK